jgi:competence protein ComEC
MKKVNINKASLKDLERIIHIGPRRAQEIIDGRPYRDVYELSAVTNLGMIRMGHIISQGVATV